MRSQDASHILNEPVETSEDSEQPPSDCFPKLETLIEQLRRYASPSDIELAAKAFELSKLKHEGQFRASGEAYFCHPFEVTLILASLNADGEMIAAGLLHDVIEDTNMSLLELEQELGKGVAMLVDGVTKLSKFSFSSKEERQAENFRRMFLAMAKDIRVIVVKLADRLHNMRTLDHLAPHKQAEIAKETLEIFAPLAHRLGIGKVKWELEDASLRFIHPEEYKRITQYIAQKRDEREKSTELVVSTLRTELEKAEVEADISGRPKHFYSIYQKMSQQNKDFHELYDITGIRVKVESEKECYEVLGTVHSLWRPIPGRFKDYIAMPKPNLYRSLHTSVIGPEGKPIEVQIRTHEMHAIAEYGIAAHWRYKAAQQSAKTETKTNNPDDLQLSWLRQLLEWQSDLKDAKEYLDTVKVDLFSDEVFVFTPKGDVFDLPRGSTPVDFAYRIHTDVGHRCTGAKLNGRIVPLNTQLSNGDIIEIITAKVSHPSLDWVNFVATPQAKNRIRQWFKKERRDDNIRRGREILEAEFGKTGFDNLTNTNKLSEMATKLHYHSTEDLIAAVGYGEVTLNQIVSRLRAELAQQAPKLPPKDTMSVHVPNPKSTQGILVGGVEGLLVSFARCCNPLPGESIIGAVTKGRGVAIHSLDCQNLSQYDPNRLLPVTWGAVQKSTYPVEIAIETIDRLGLLKDILAKLSDTKTNILGANVTTHKDKTARINLVVEIQDMVHLQRIMNTISHISDVLNVSRVNRGRSKTSGNGSLN